MKRRTVVINSVLGVAVLGVAVVAGVSISSAGNRPEPTGQTVAVQRGTVTATVSATGNVEAGTSVSVDLAGSGGTVRKIYVREGRKVEKGDRLLRIDETSARRSLKTAKASLASAQAQLTTATQGRSAADRRVDDASVRSAQTALDNAKTAARQARQTRAQDKRQQNASVSSAESAVDRAADRLAADRRLLAAAQRAGDQTQIATLKSTVASDQTSLATAKSSRTQAKQTRDKTLLADSQAIQTQDGQVASAQDTLTSQKAQRDANAQPARQGAVDSAQAQVDSAQVSVDEARSTLANTTLRAPVDGTVIDVAAVVGQSSSAAGASSSAGSSTGSGGSGGDAGSTGTDSAASASSASSGLVTLATIDAKQVSASVAEADVVKVKSGQQASVQFPASGRSLNGTVTTIASESSVTNNVVQYAVAVSLPSAGRSIRLGQTADVTITTGSHTDALYVPTSAVSTANGHSTVTRRVNNTDSVVEVQTGLVGAVGTEIVRGVSEGDLLVLPTGNTNQAYTFPGAGGSAGSSASPSGGGTPR